MAIDTRVGDALGWVSLGLGVATLLAPRAVARATGLSDQTTLLRLVGARELVSGVGLLTMNDQRPWLWSRVAGDVMDLALLGSALRPGNPDRTRAIGAIGAVAAITGVDVGESVRQTVGARRERGHEWRADRRPSRAREAYVEQSMTVNKPPQECYDFWRNEENHPKFSRMVESVTRLDERRSHWVVKGPGGVKLQWDAEITDDRPGERLTWHSLEGAPVLHAGTVRFDRAVGGRGTVIRVLMHYRPRMGRTSVGLAKLIGHDPGAEVREDLRRFKALLETGEIPTTRGQPSGRRSFLGRLTPGGRRSRQEQRAAEEASYDRHATTTEGARA